MPMRYGLSERGNPRARSLKLAERLPTIPTGNGCRCVIVRAVAYLHARLSHLARNSRPSGCHGTVHSHQSRFRLVDRLADFIRVRQVIR